MSTPSTAYPCPRCGAPAKPGNAFCTRCGLALSAPTPPPIPPSAPSPGIPPVYFYPPLPRKEFPWLTVSVIAVLLIIALLIVLLADSLGKDIIQAILSLVPDI